MMICRLFTLHMPVLAPQGSEEAHIIGNIASDLTSQLPKHRPVHKAWQLHSELFLLAQASSKVVA